MYRLRIPVEEVVRTLLIVMRRGSLSGAEEITGHKLVAYTRQPNRHTASSTAAASTSTVTRTSRSMRTLAGRSR